MSRSRWRGGALRLAVVIWLVSGCGRGDSTEVAPDVPPPPADALSKAMQNGPVKATVTVWPPKPMLSDPVYVRLTVEAEPGVSVELPFQTGQLGDAALGRFRVIDFGTTSRTEGNAVREEHTYTLQARASGRHRIPPFRLEMLDRRNASGAGAGSGAGSGAAEKPLELLTEEIPLDIAPIPVEKVTASLQPAHGALATSVGGRPWWMWAVLAAAALAWLAAGYALLRRWRARQRLARQRTAYDDAVAELVALEEAGPPDEHAADSWFVRLSGIIRNYLERRYDIRAPELTTEEFLQQALGTGHLSAEHRKLLQSFLERCDRVKFAAYRPESKESLETLAAARSFVEDTRLREVAGARLAQEGRDAA